jgi:predicted DNA-binding WGR domain protein
MSKTTKTLEDFTEVKPTRKVELEIFDPSEGHNKFWRCYIFNVGSDYFVARHWGRNGSKGQQMVECFTGHYHGEYSAIESFTKLGDEKLRKGYRPEASPLDKIVREV